MLVGEQPGDQEDLAGKPFVGPAGRMLDRAMADAGLDRDKTFVTNAVKHFKHEMRGKRRLHKKPNAGEIDRCRWWFDIERALVRPKLVVAMGATAARSVLGRAVTIRAVRGQALPLPDGTTGFVTIHPSALLRIRDDGDKEREYRAFVADLRRAAKFRLGLNPDQSSSPNPDDTSLSSASMTAAASSPVASTVMVVPVAAPSIISPMIEVPPTVSPPRVTRTSASKRSTVCTNFAEARACRPFLLTISRTRTRALRGGCGRTGRRRAAVRSLICRRARGWRW